MTDRPTIERLTAGELAEAFAVSKSAVKYWTQEGCPVCREGRRVYFDPAEVAAWRKSRGMDTQPGGGSGNPDLDAARLRKENALADKYELQVARERGTLIVAETEYASHAENLAGIRDRMLMVPAALSARIANASEADAEAMLRRAILDALQVSTDPTIDT